MNRQWYVFALLFVTCFVSGCASFITDNRDVLVRVYTTPPGAHLTVLGNTKQSPATLWVPRGEGDIEVRVEKAGFQAGKIILKETENKWINVNVLNLFLAVPIDLMNGAAYDLDQKDIHLTLIKN